MGGDTEAIGVNCKHHLPFKIAGKRFVLGGLSYTRLLKKYGAVPIIMTVARNLSAQHGDSLGVLPRSHIVHEFMITPSDYPIYRHMAHRVSGRIYCLVIPNIGHATRERMLPCHNYMELRP